jgi:CubicO group peptidase (beta-lactamase class C family)
MKIRLWALLVFAAAGKAAAGPEWLKDFDAAAERGLKSSQTAGLGVGVIQDGKVLLAKGYGYRDITAGKPVTPKTIFAMGSVTKSFTAASVASVIDQGKLEWDKPVREYLPWFRLHDPVATEWITVRDMLTHRSGLPRHDFLRFSTYLTREELVRRLRFLEPSRPFRDVYQYNNLMFVAAGYLAGAVSGSTWEDLVRARIFTPLEMTRSNTSVLDSQKSDDYALPYNRGASGPERQEFYVYSKFGVGPNGAVNSTVEDMLKYLQMWLDNGAANGRTLISKEQMAELKKPVTVVNATTSYAPGWNFSQRGGRLMISHGGAITGFRAHALLLPQLRTGIVAMINGESGLAGDMALELADRVLGVSSKEAQNPQGGPRREAPKSQPGTKPSKPLPDYAGRYSHPAYGTVRVEQDGDGLLVRFDAMNLRLKHFHYDTFSSSMGMARFALNERGAVGEMHLPLEPAVRPLLFLRLE